MRPKLALPKHVINPLIPIRIEELSVPPNVNPFDESGVFLGKCVQCVATLELERAKRGTEANMLAAIDKHGLQQ